MPPVHSIRRAKAYPTRLDSVETLSWEEVASLCFPPECGHQQPFCQPKNQELGQSPGGEIVISDPQRLQQTVARLRQLGYPLVEHAPPPPD